MKTFSYLQERETEEDTNMELLRYIAVPEGTPKKAKSQKINTRTPDLSPGHIRTRPGYV
jgi:hypothetical protein